MPAAATPRAWRTAPTRTRASPPDSPAARFLVCSAARYRRGGALGQRLIASRFLVCLLLISGSWDLGRWEEGEERPALTRCKVRRLACLRRSGSSDSNRHTLSPASFVSSHHRSPTSSRPVTFFTCVARPAASRDELRIRFSSHPPPSEAPQEGSCLAGCTRPRRDCVARSSAPSKSRG